MNINDELLEVLEAALEWIDTVPSYLGLPTMPEFDRDWANDVIHTAKNPLLENQNTFPDMKETHCQGHVSIENIPEGLLLNDDLGIMMENGKVWLCVNGIALLRFKPKMRKK